MIRIVPGSNSVVVLESEESLLLSCGPGGKVVDGGGVSLCWVVVDSLDFIDCLLE